MRCPPGACSPSLQARAPVKNDHQVFAQSLSLLFLTFPQSFAGGNHEHDGNYPPRDPEHCQERAKLVRPKCSKNVADEITKNHSGWTRLKRIGKPPPEIDTHSFKILLQK